MDDLPRDKASIQTTPRNMISHANRPTDIIVSTIVINWNCRRHLDACLRSLREQTQAGVELIHVDGGSTNGSVKFLREHSQDIELIALRENQGFSRASKVGI